MHPLHNGEFDLDTALYIATTRKLAVVQFNKSHKDDRQSFSTNNYT